MTAKKENPKKAGRKWFDGKNEQQVLGKLEEVTALDASIEECLYYANITVDSYYNYLKNHPEFAKRLQMLREKPVLLARQTVIQALKNNPDSAKWYLERKKKREFSTRQELTGADGEAVKIEGVNITIRK